MMDSSVVDRANGAGAVGLYLKGLLSEDWVWEVRSLPFEAQISRVYQPTYLGRPVSLLERAAAAFLVPDYPVQVRVEAAQLKLVVANCVEPYARPSLYSDVQWGRHVRGTLQRFGLKKNTAASNKVNVYLSEVLADLRGLSESAYTSAAAALAPWSGHLYNDQASAVVLYGFGLASCGLSNSYELAATLVGTPELAKSLTTFIKAVGANGSRLGALLCEANTLQGRDVGDIDLLEEARYRTTQAVHSKVAHFPEPELRKACRDILEEEIALRHGNRLVDFPTLEDHWDQRWAWAVNGAHSGHASRAYPTAVPRPPGMLREHRRAWLERQAEDPRVEWDGHTYVSASKKLEAGKTRAIFACDTVNYLAFEHLLGPVEARWRHSNVILDPGRGGHLGMVFTTQAARSRSGVSMMLDYDDFNSQHTLRAQQILLEELIDLTGYPPHLAGPLLASLEKMDVYVGAQRVGRMRGTLASGHRGTTFFNSVLNRAYLAIVLGPELLGANVALHVGDDVYLGVRTYLEAGRVARALGASPLRMNPIKQSVGHVSTEFLRCASSGRATYGYFARGVASTVAGNWVSEAALSPSEGITTMLNAARTLANRAGSRDLPLLLKSSLVRMTRLGKEHHRKLRELLAGSLALDNGPQFQHSGYYRQTRLVVGVTATDQHGLAPLPHLATQDFLSRASAPLEVDVLTQAGVSVVGAMEEASFRKSLPARYAAYETVQLGPVSLSTAIGSESVAELVRKPVPRGVLSRYPLLVLAKKRIPDYLVKWAVAQAGGNPNAPDLALEAWGEYKHGCIIASPMSYSDAAMYGKRTSASVLYAPVDTYV